MNLIESSETRDVRKVIRNVASGRISGNTRHTGKYNGLKPPKYGCPRFFHLQKVVVVVIFLSVSSCLADLSLPAQN